MDLFILLIRSVLNSEYNVVLPSYVNWNELFQISQEQNVLPIVADALEHISDEVPVDIWAKWDANRTNQIVLNFTQCYELEWLIDSCKSYKIRILPLKGCTLKTLYDKPEYRTMGDIDFYFDFSDAYKLKNLLLEREYNCTEFNTLHSAEPSGLRCVSERTLCGV